VEFLEVILWLALQLEMRAVGAFCRSTQLISETWEEIARSFSFGLIFTLLAIPAIAFTFTQRLSGNSGLVAGRSCGVTILLAITGRGRPAMFPRFRPMTTCKPRGSRKIAYVTALSDVRPIHFVVYREIHHNLPLPASGAPFS